MQLNLCQVYDLSASSLVHCVTNPWLQQLVRALKKKYCISCCEFAKRNEYQVVLVGTMCHFFPLSAGSSLLEWPK